MPTVYAIDIRRKAKVRYLGVVHYGGSESIPDHSGYVTPPSGTPHAARCGTVFESMGETPAYLGDSNDIVVTCVACASDRRR